LTAFVSAKAIGVARKISRSAIKHECDFQFIRYGS
jgi:hypothetical protein